MIDHGRSLVALTAALVLGLAFAFGGFLPQRIALVVTAAILVVAAAVVSDPLRDVQLPSYRQVAMVVMPVAVGVFMMHLVHHFPHDTTAETLLMWGGFIAVAVLAGLFAVGRGGTAVWAGLLAVYGLMMAAVITLTLTGKAPVDVMVFQRDGAAALLRFENPFAMTFPDIYPPFYSALFYAEGLSVDGVLQFGYPYFPLGLVAVAPFEWIADFRFGHLIAVLASAVMMSRMSKHPFAKLAAAVFVLVSPSVFLVREGYMDPLVVLAICTVTLLAVRGSKTVSAVSGLMYATKQYTAFLLIPSLLLLERPWSLRTVVKHFASAAAVFLLVTLPFALWDFGAFWWSTVELQFIQPYRADSIALPALVPGTWEELSPLLTVGGPLLVVIAVSIWVAIKTPTGGQGFALGAAAVLIAGFVTSKQAFANYYFVVIGALCAGVAAVPIASEHETPLAAEIGSTVGD